jgi:serine/threonine protein kinase
MLYLVLRYVQGADLEALILRDGPMKLDDATTTLLPIAGALDAAHAFQLVHRDVKPPNILVTEGSVADRKVYLSDFGLVKSMAPLASARTATGGILGTAAYMAPEAWKSEKLDGRADQYSLACTLFYALVGEPPFGRAEAYVLMHRHLDEPVPAISERIDILPPELDEIISTAMAKDRADRFPTCSAFLRAAADLVEPRAPIAVTEPAIRPKSRRRATTVAPRRPSPRRISEKTVPPAKRPKAGTKGTSQPAKNAKAQQATPPKTSAKAKPKPERERPVRRTREAKAEPRVISGRYRLDRKIAIGGMTEVFEATDTLLERRVAVKVLLPQFASDEAFGSRVRREAQAAAVLNHPNAVTVYDAGADEGIVFVVEEYVQGRSLRDFLASGQRADRSQSVRIAISVADALGAAHAIGLVHRDISPANILMTPIGQVKVLNFGSARIFAGSEAGPSAEAGYLSPEQAQGMNVDGRSDLFSLGTVLYVLLTGRLPFEGDSPVAIAYKVVTQDPEPPTSIEPSISPALEATVLKALAKDPRRRYQTAEELVHDLRRAGAPAPRRRPVRRLRPGA